MKSNLQAIKELVICLCILAFSDVAFAQKDDDHEAALIGKHCPDFSFTNLVNYSKYKASLADFKGKPLILDFFASWCSPCVGAFPKLDSLQQEFDGKIQILTVGWDDEQKDRALFKRLLDRKILNFQKLCMAFDTALIKNNIKVGNGLITVWIDADGIIRYYSGSEPVTERNLELFAAGKKIDELEEILNNHNKAAGIAKTSGGYQRDKPILVNNNGGMDSNYFYRSILTPYLSQIGWDGYPNWFVPKESVPVFKMHNLPLSFLYELAYRPQLCPNPMQAELNMYGNFLVNPVLELKDSSAFRYYWNAQSPDSAAMNRYCYELTLPNTLNLNNSRIVDSAMTYVNPVKDVTQFERWPGYPTEYSLKMQKVMQQDLANYFGYKVSVEKRKHPCFFLEVDEEAKKKLTSLGGKSDIIQNEFGLKLVNQPVRKLIAYLWQYNQFTGFKVINGVHDYTENIIIDKSGIDFNIDIDINCKMDNVESVKGELKKNGLRLVKGEKEVGVIVIHDK